MERKTFVSTVLIYNDVPMEIVSELLGHSSLKISKDKMYDQIAFRPSINWMRSEVKEFSKKVTAWIGIAIFLRRFEYNHQTN
ncbi:hypothetical protein [Eudoraea sp.]|uniref:hypothetical protein n=1 Tax=Eudoraea sp. TaxID=1979955 RepID=UPI003C74D8BD